MASKWVFLLRLSVFPSHIFFYQHFFHFSFPLITRLHITIRETQAWLLLFELFLHLYLPPGVLATRQGHGNLEAKGTWFLLPPHSHEIWRSFYQESCGWRLCGQKTQLPNVLVNIHKNMSVLLNPQQMIIIRLPTPCIFLLLILLFALNSFPQLLLPHPCVLNCCQ